MSSVIALRLAGVGLFGFAIVLPPVTATASALAGIVVSALSLRLPEVHLRSRFMRLIAAAFGVLSLLVGIDRGALRFPDPAGVMPGVIAISILVMAVLVVAGRPLPDRGAVVVGVLLFAVLTLEVMGTFGGNLYGLDVYRSHEAAADAVRDTANPYTDAVTVVDGSPNAAPGDVIEGYSYPPVTLVGYVTGDLLAGDPRWTSVVSVLGLVGAIAWLLRRRWDLAAPVLLLVAAIPLQRAMVWSGWTEPLSAALLFAGVVAWRREWLSPILIGLALASKQYLVVLVPLLILIDRRPWRRTVVSVGVAGLTLVPAAIADFSAFWFTMVSRPLGLGFRPDTRSLSGALAELGVSVEVPAWLMLVVVASASVGLASRVRTRSDLLSAAAVVLALTFVFSLAFANYWWLVQWTAALAVAISTVEPDEIIRIDASSSV